MKRITISITNSFERDRRMIRTASALKDQGYTVNVISKGNKQKVESNPDDQRIKTWSAKGIFFYLEYNLRLFIKLMGTSTDALLSVDSDTLLANTLVSKLRSFPLYIDMHELFTDVPELLNAPIKKSIWKWIEKRGINQSEGRYTVSDTIAKSYLDRYGKPFEVVRNVPSISVEAQIQKHERFTLIYLGAVNMGRGLEELLQSMSTLPNTDLIILGTGDIHDDLQQLASDLNLDERVRFLGWQDPDQISGLLQKAHAGINLLDPMSQSYYQSLANKYFDYIHAGIPSISMNFPEYRTLNDAHTTSVLIDSLEQRSIQNAVIKLQEDTAYYQSLSDATDKAKEEWNWQKESLKLRSIFDL